MARPPAGVTDDLAVLGDLTEEILLSELKQRYGKDNIYVSSSEDVARDGRVLKCTILRGASRQPDLPWWIYL